MFLTFHISKISYINFQNFTVPFTRFHFPFKKFHSFIYKILYFNFQDFTFQCPRFHISISKISYFYFQDFFQRTFRFRTMNCYSGLLFHFIIFRTIQFGLNEHEILPTWANSGQIRSWSQVAALFSRELN